MNGEFTNVGQLYAFFFTYYFYFFYVLGFFFLISLWIHEIVPYSIISNDIRKKERKKKNKTKQIITMEKNWEVGV